MAAWNINLSEKPDQVALWWIVNNNPDNIQKVSFNFFYFINFFLVFGLL
jgi:hypothetical protein